MFDLELLKSRDLCPGTYGISVSMRIPDLVLPCEISKLKPFIIQFEGLSLKFNA